MTRHGIRTRQKHGGEVSSQDFYLPPKMATSNLQIFKTTENRKAAVVDLDELLQALNYLRRPQYDTPKCRALALRNAQKRPVWRPYQRTRLTEGRRKPRRRIRKFPERPLRRRGVRTERCRADARGRKHAKQCHSSRYSIVSPAHFRPRTSLQQGEAIS